MAKENTHLWFAYGLLEHCTGSAMLRDVSDHLGRYMLGAVILDTFYYSAGDDLVRISEAFHGRDGNPTNTTILRVIDAARGPADIAFILGYITHCALDITFHPVVYYLSGNYYDDDPIMVPKARNLRVVLTSADGKSLGHMQAIVNKAGDEEGWFTVAVPLAALGLNEQTGGFALSRLGVSLDFPDTFWIGRIRVITDESPIYVDPMDEQTVGSGDTLVMKAEAEAGITSLVYSWDFNAADGIQEDAVGQLAEMMYKTAGTFTVTLTVRDPDGIKKPVTTKVKIEVT